MIQAIEEKAADILQPARQRLKETFGFSSFRQGQERAIQAALSGRDLLVIMPTGSGKSLCYQVPALVLPGVTVVVSPLIALMKDQVDGLRSCGVPANGSRPDSDEGSYRSSETRCWPTPAKMAVTFPGGDA